MVNSYRQKWKLVKAGGIKPPPEVFVIEPSLKMRNRGYLWIAASAISDVTLFGWEFQYLPLPLLEQTKAWQICIRTRFIRRVQNLDIDFKTHFGGWIGAHILETILPMIQDLPNLRTFKLKQYYNGGDPKAHQDSAANVFELLEIQDWPKLSQMELQRPKTRDKDEFFA